MLSYSRLPAALAADGLLPSLFAWRHPVTDVPAWGVVACALGYVACLGLGFERLVELDVLLYGASLVLEFVALGVLRVREPALARPFRVPGGLAGVILLSVPPVALVGLAFAASIRQAEGPRSFVLGGCLLAAGPLLYLLARRTRAVAGPGDLP
jgi:amino acid transporter